MQRFVLLSQTYEMSKATAKVSQSWLGKQDITQIVLCRTHTGDKRSQIVDIEEHNYDKRSQIDRY